MESKRPESGTDYDKEKISEESEEEMLKSDDEELDQDFEEFLPPPNGNRDSKNKDLKFPEDRSDSEGDDKNFDETSDIEIKETEKFDNPIPEEGGEGLQLKLPFDSNKIDVLDDKMGAKRRVLLPKSWVVAILILVILVTFILGLVFLLVPSGDTLLESETIKTGQKNLNLEVFPEASSQAENNTLSSVEQEPLEEPDATEFVTDSPVEESVVPAGNQSEDSEKIESVENEELVSPPPILEEKTPPASPVKMKENPDKVSFSEEIKSGKDLWRISFLMYKKDPWLWKYILFKNKQKIQYILFDSIRNSWEVKVKSGTKLNLSDVREAGLPSFKNPLKYATQLVAFPEQRIDEALRLNRELISRGHYAYLYKTEEKIHNAYSGQKEYFYRIRVGFFKTEKEALETGERIYRQYEGGQIFPSNFFVVVPSKDEVSGKNIEFGIQNQRPFVIEVDRTKNLGTALKITAVLNQKPYIAYTVKTKIKGDIYYKVRYGFFSSLNQAEKERKILEKNYRSLRIVKPNNLLETALGQNTGNQAGKLVLGR